MAASTRKRQLARERSWGVSRCEACERFESWTLGVHPTPNGYRCDRCLLPPQQAAHVAVREALRKGSLRCPQQCESCGQGSRLRGHHPDYTQPLRVIWLCPGCHADFHRIPLLDWRVEKMVQAYLYQDALP